MKKFDMFLCTFGGTLAALIVAWLMLLSVGNYLLRSSNEESLKQMQKGMADVAKKFPGENLNEN